jgi:hypothetical protein
MMTPDQPAKAPTPQVVAPLDPAVAARVILMEAEYLRTQAIAMLRAARPDVTHMDLSPLGRRQAP